MTNHAADKGIRCYAALTLGLVSLVLAGCIAAPIPLRKHDTDTVRFDEAAPFNDGTIEERRAIWSVPVLFSAEGMGTTPISETEYRYFLCRNGSREKIELPWLRYKSGTADFHWMRFRAIKGTPWFFAFRVDKQSLEDGAKRPELREFFDYEVVVFDGRALKHRRLLTMKNEAEFYFVLPKDLRFDADSRAIEYLTPSGWKRYRIIEDMEKPLATGTVEAGVTGK